MQTDIQVGAKVTVTRETLEHVSQKHVSVQCEGHVYYVHPQRRYFVVEYEDGIKESFHFTPSEEEHVAIRVNRNRKHR